MAETYSFTSVLSVRREVISTPPGKTYTFTTSGAEQVKSCINAGVAVNSSTPKEALVQHKKVHYVHCPVCGGRFNRPSLMQAHLSLKHKQAHKVNKKEEPTFEIHHQRIVENAEEEKKEAKSNYRFAIVRKLK